MKLHENLLAEYCTLTIRLETVKKNLFEWFSSLSLEEKLKVFLVDKVPLDDILKKEPYILDFEKEPWERRSDCGNYFEFVERYQDVSIDDIYKNFQNYYEDDDGEIVQEDSLFDFLYEKSIDEKVKFILDDDSISSRYLKQMLDKNIYCFEYDW